MTSASSSVTASPTTDSSETNSSETNPIPNQQFLHFGNMGGLLPTLEIDDLPDSESNGAKMTFFYCRQCHNVPGPGMHTVEEWSHVFWKMYWRMHLMNAQFKNFKVPKYDEGQVMYEYLKQNAMHSVKAADVDTAATGAKEYMRTCMQCHQLPNPQMHVKKQWPEVVKRMRRHMKSMSKITPSKTDMNAIIQYLKEHAKPTPIQ